RVILARELAVRLLQFRVGDVLRDAERLVEGLVEPILAGHRSPTPRERRRRPSLDAARRRPAGIRPRPPRVWSMSQLPEWAAGRSPRDAAGRTPPRPHGRR